jgi:hypothetical protein
MVQCLEAFTLAKVRAIVVAPASTSLPGEYLVDGFRVLHLPALPLGSELVLCRKCAAVVCSGDAWTVHASLRAGTPVLPLRFSGGASHGSGEAGGGSGGGGPPSPQNNEASAEAEFWGRAAAAKGAASLPIAAADISASTLGRLVRRLVNPDAPERAACRDLSLAMQEMDNGGGGGSGARSGKRAGSNTNSSSGGMGKAVNLIAQLALPIAAIRVAGAAPAPSSPSS